MFYSFDSKVEYSHTSKSWIFQIWRYGYEMAQQNSNTTMSSLTETPIKRTADSLENDSSPVQVKKARKYEYTHSTFNNLHYKNRTTVNLKVSTDVNGQKNYRVVDGNGREFKMLLPPSQVEWPKLAQGGNYDPKSLYSNTEATANLEVTWASNANTQFEGAQNDFLKMNAEQDKFLMRALFESSARREKIIAEVEKACAGKDLPSDKIEDKAFSKFLRKANSNVKQIKDPSTKKVTGHTIKISRKAYMFPQGPEAPAVPVQATFYNKSYKVYPQPPKVGNGDTLGVVVRKYVYDGEKGYGIKYMLVPDAVVVYAKSKGLKDASRYDIMGRQATYDVVARWWDEANHAKTNAARLVAELRTELSEVQDEYQQEMRLKQKLIERFTDEVNELKTINTDLRTETETKMKEMKRLKQELQIEFKYEFFILH